MYVGRYRTRRVLGVWALLTAGATAYVYYAVVFGGTFGPPLVPGIVAVGLGGGGLAVASRRPSYALAAVPPIGVDVLSASLGCPAVACPGEEQLRGFLRWTWLGPAVSASTDPGRCAYYCPHTVQLVPLAIGYLLAGAAVAPGSGR